MVVFSVGPGLVNACWALLTARSVDITASSSYSGIVDNFWSRGDVRVHTFGGSPKAVEVLAEGFVRGQADPHRSRGSVEERKRRGSPSLRTCPVGVRQLSRLGARARIRTPRL